MILKGLEPLLREARQNNLVFRCPYQNLIFTPDELEQEHKDGSFIWGATNWELVDPKKILSQLELKAREARRAVTKLRLKLRSESIGKIPGEV